MNESLVSVIVPIYKVENYLCACVDSILSQSYPHLDIILVDDGSPDGCPAICDEYAQKDARVRVIHQKNGGLSAARNAGIDACRGDYLTFVDSDDFLQGRFIELLLDACQTEQADIAIGEIERVSYDTAPEKVSAPLSDPVVRRITGRDANFMIYNIATWTRVTTACGKLYRRSLFKQTRYPIIALHEDEALTYKLLYQSNAVAVCDSAVYYYRTNPTSLMNQSFAEKKLLIFPILEERAAFYREHGEDKLYQDTILREFYIATQYYVFVSQKMPESPMAAQLRDWQKRSYQTLRSCCSPGFGRTVKYALMRYVPRLCSRFL